MRIEGNSRLEQEGGGSEEFDNPSSDEEEPTLVENTTKGPAVAFPTEEEFKAGYVWGMDAVFKVRTENVRRAVSVETNH